MGKLGDVVRQHGVAPSRTSQILQHGHGVLEHLPAARLRVQRTNLPGERPRSGLIEVGASDERRLENRNQPLPPFIRRARFPHRLR
jgi:hypothetical protein